MAKPTSDEALFWRPRYGRPDPMRDPDGYMRWLVGEPTGGDLQPISFPMIDDAYTIGPSAAPAEKRWFVVVTEPRHETQVAHEIRETEDGSPREGFDVLNIRLRTIEVRRQRKREVDRPLFPGYVFAGLARPLAGFSVIHDIDGTRGILGRYGAPLPVPTAIVDALRAREAAGEFDKTVLFRWMENMEWVVPGIKIRVSEGPFEGLPGVIQRINRGRQHVRAELSIFGRPTAVELRFAQFVQA